MAVGAARSPHPDGRLAAQRLFGKPAGQCGRSCANWCANDIADNSMTSPKHNGTAMHPQDWLRLILLSVLWGASFFFIGVALRDLPPLTIVLARAVFGAVLIPFFLLRGGVFPRSPSGWLPFLVMGAFTNSISFSLVVVSQNYLSSVGAQCDNPAVHRAGACRTRRRAADRAPHRRRADRACRRDHPARRNGCDAARRRRNLSCIRRSVWLSPPDAYLHS